MINVIEIIQKKHHSSQYIWNSIYLCNYVILLVINWEVNPRTATRALKNTLGYSGLHQKQTKKRTPLKNKSNTAAIKQVKKQKQLLAALFDYQHTTYLLALRVSILEKEWNWWKRSPTPPSVRLTFKEELPWWHSWVNRVIFMTLRLPVLLKVKDTCKVWWVLEGVFLKKHDSSKAFWENTGNIATFWTEIRTNVNHTLLKISSFAKK